MLVRVVFSRTNVGASLLAMAEYQSHQVLTVATRSRAGSLPQEVCLIGAAEALPVSGFERRTSVAPARRCGLNVKLFITL